jgi:hypothetical protein
VKMGGKDFRREFPNAEDNGVPEKDLEFMGLKSYIPYVVDRSPRA